MFIKKTLQLPEIILFSKVLKQMNTQLVKYWTVDNLFSYRFIYLLTYLFENIRSTPFKCRKLHKVLYIQQWMRKTKCSGVVYILIADGGQKKI